MVPRMSLSLWMSLLPGCVPVGDSGQESAAPPVETAPPGDSAVPVPEELCDGIDNDGDGLIDEIYDLDGDGYLVDDPACEAMGPDLDCDDDDADIHPGAAEPCDGVDNDCSGEVDDADVDGDGATVCEDCDDADAAIHPGAEEVCDGMDNDCSGAADEPWDMDGDGVAPCAGDCDDANYYRSPLIPEQCDGMDNDCDGDVDEGFDEDGDGVSTCRGDCDDGDPSVYWGAPELCDGVDNDCDASTVEDADEDADGYSLCEGDCDDEDATANPGAEEICGDGVDNDCSGGADDLPECYDCVEDSGYLLCHQATTWAMACTICEQSARHLVTIDSDSENSTLWALLGTSLGADTWIGFNDLTTEGTWQWVDGSPVSYTQWHSGEPNDSGGEDCAELYKTYGDWNDLPCTSSLAFICE